MGTPIEPSLKFLVHQLLEMGFSEKEMSMAVDSFGPETPLCELVDAILAKRIAYDVKNTSSTVLQNSKGIAESEIVIHADGVKCNVSSMSLTSGDNRHREDGDLHNRQSLKKVERKKESTNCLSKKLLVDMPNQCNTHYNAAESAIHNARSVVTNSSISVKCCQYPSEPPYLVYGNVIDISEKAWKSLSRFLFSIEPEYMNSELFSALTRKEGFIHNLPRENRVHTFPGSPRTIQEALIFTEKSWPSWDTRKKLHGITTCTADIDKTCKRLEKIMRNSQGVLSPEQKADFVHECRSHNLLWAGAHSLVALTPDDADIILGYPVQHTLVSGLDNMERLEALKHSFQTDLLCYMLSPLKSCYPDGLRVLSVFSGIGGAEIALSKLGIPLKCVVSIEASEINRQILRKWWDRTKQSGYLGQLRSIQELSREQVRGLIEEFGGFDLIVAGNPYTFSKYQDKNSEGVNFTLFFEFYRLFQAVKGIMSSKK